MRLYVEQRAPANAPFEPILIEKIGTNEAFQRYRCYLVRVD